MSKRIKGWAIVRRKLGFVGVREFNKTKHEFDGIVIHKSEGEALERVTMIVESQPKISR